MPSNYRSYDSPTFGRFSMGPGSLAVLMVAALLLMLPFTQYLAGLKKDDRVVRQFDVAPPPPSFTPPEPPPPPDPPPDEPPPQMDTPPPQLTLSQLSMAMNVGAGGALAGDFSLGDMSVSADETRDAIMEFDIADLDEQPRMTRQPPIPYSPRMKRERREGVIEMVGIINPDGSVEIREVVESINEDYTSMFQRYFSSLRYTKPTVGGEPVSARITFRVPVQWR